MIFFLNRFRLFFSFPLNGISMFPICAHSSLAANERQESRARVLITTTWSRRRAGVWFCKADGAIGKWLLGGTWGFKFQEGRGHRALRLYGQRNSGNPEWWGHLASSP